MSIERKKIRTIISCFYDGEPVPIGFSWSKTLATQFKGRYNQTILLHGDCLKYGLRSSAYRAKFGTENPFECYLYELFKCYKIRIVICQLCLEADGFKLSDLLPFVKPIAFSVDFIAQSQAKKGAVIIYDAKLST